MIILRQKEFAKYKSLSLRNPSGVKQAIKDANAAGIKGRSIRQITKNQLEQAYKDPTNRKNRRMLYERSISKNLKNPTGGYPEMATKFSEVIGPLLKKSLKK